MLALCDEGGKHERCLMMQFLRTKSSEWRMRKDSKTILPRPVQSFLSFFHRSTPPSARVAPKATVAAAIRAADTKPEWETVRPSALLRASRPNQTAPFLHFVRTGVKLVGPSLLPSLSPSLPPSDLPLRRTVMVMGAWEAAELR